jgi:hypothetical protein
MGTLWRSDTHEETLSGRDGMWDRGAGRPKSGAGRSGIRVAPARRSEYNSLPGFSWNAVDGKTCNDDDNNTYGDSGVGDGRMAGSSAKNSLADVWIAIGEIVCHERLGGLLRFYRRAA